MDEHKRITALEHKVKDCDDKIEALKSEYGLREAHV